MGQEPRVSNLSIQPMSVSEQSAEKKTWTHGDPVGQNK